MTRIAKYFIFTFFLSGLYTTAAERRRSMRPPVAPVMCKRPSMPQLRVIPYAPGLLPDELDEHGHNQCWDYPARRWAGCNDYRG